MTTLSPIATSRPAASTASAEPTVSSAPLTGLPEPTASPFGSSDPLAELLQSMQHLSDSSLALSATRIQDTRAALHEQLDEYLEKLQELSEKLRAAKEDDGGFFGACFDFVGDLLGEVVGTLVDLQVDLLTTPVELGVDVVKNFNDPAAMLQAMQATSVKLVENGGTAEDVHGFTQGVVAFAGDLAELSARLSIDLARSALSGEGLNQATREDLHHLWGSLKQNVLDNPHFWAVTAAVGKGVAVAGAVMSGGALAPVAIGLMVLMEADQRFGVIEELVGKKAAPWVRLGVEAGAAACLLAGGASGSRVLDLLRLGTGVVQGAGAVYSGYRTIESAEARADELEQQAELTTSLNRVQRLQRLLDTLLSSLEDDAKSNEQTRTFGTGLVQTRVATDAALILPA